MLEVRPGAVGPPSADADRSRIDWKRELGLEPADTGVDASVLSKFRARLAPTTRQNGCCSGCLPAFGERELLGGSAHRGQSVGRPGAGRAGSTGKQLAADPIQPADMAEGESAERGPHGGGGRHPIAKHHLGRPVAPQLHVVDAVPPAIGVDRARRAACGLGGPRPAGSPGSTSWSAAHSIPSRSVSVAGSSARIIRLRATV